MTPGRHGGRDATLLHGPPDTARREALIGLHGDRLGAAEVCPVCERGEGVALVAFGALAQAGHDAARFGIHCHLTASRQVVACR